MESNNNNDFGKIIRNVGLFIGIPLVFFLILWLFLDPRTSSSNVKYSDYVAYFENNQVESYTLDLGQRQSGTHPAGSLPDQGHQQGR